jgi:hypothetical protein
MSDCSFDSQISHLRGYIPHMFASFLRFRDDATGDLPQSHPFLQRVHKVLNLYHVTPPLLDSWSTRVVDDYKSKNKLSSLLCSNDPLYEPFSKLELKVLSLAKLKEESLLLIMQQKELIEKLQSAVMQKFVNLSLALNHVHLHFYF